MAGTGCRESEAAMVFLWSIVAFTVFRFIFTWLMRYIRPEKLLVVASAVAVICVVMVMMCPVSVAVWAIVATSAAMSLMFPTIYGIALGNVEPSQTKVAASGLIMAILGGALITPVQAFISDVAGITASFAVPLVCFVIILIYASKSVNQK